MGGMSFQFPPLSLSAKVILGVNAAVWAVMLILYYFAPESAATIAQLAFLDPTKVTHGYLFQLATYMFFHDLNSPFHIVMNMLLVYFFAAPLDAVWGPKKTLWFAFGAGIAGGVIIMLFHFASLAFGFGPGNPTLGFSGAALGMLAAFCLLHAEAQILLFFVIPIKAKFIIPLTIGIDFLVWVTPSSDISFPAHLGGIAFGWFMFGGSWAPQGLIRRLKYRKHKRWVDNRDKQQQKENVLKGPWLH